MYTGEDICYNGVRGGFWPLIFCREDAMPEVENTAFLIAAAFEDDYFVTAKRTAFNAVFNRYLPLVDPAAALEPYEAIVELGYRHREEFDRMVQELKELSLIEG